MKILTTNGFTRDGSYGAWLNEIMRSAPCEWVAFMDHDIYLANRNWHRIIEESVAAAPDGGLFTCVTNRLGNPKQKIKIDRGSNDLKYHMQVAEDIEKRDPKLLDVTWDKRKISGVMMITSKSAWRDSGGFREKGGYIGVDNCYHGVVRAAGYKVYIINNLYVYHWYRGSTK